MTKTTWGALRQTAEDATKPLPADWYDVAIEKSEATTASTGSPMIKVTLVVTSGAQANNRKVWTQFVLKADSPFALTMFFKNLAAFGLGETFFDSLPDNIEEGLPLIANTLVGRTARAKIEPRAYQGVERDNVTELAPGTGGGQVSGIATPGGAPIPSIAATPPTPQISAPPTPGAGPATPPSAPPTLAF